SLRSKRFRWHFAAASGREWHVPWFPIRGVVRKLRFERGWTREELARKAGVKPRTVWLWESENVPRTGHDDSVRGIAAAHRVMPAIVGSALGLQSMVCGQCLVVRRVHNGDVCYASMFSATPEQTAGLLDAAEAKIPLTVVARIVIKEPDKECKGFFFFQKK